MSIRPKITFADSVQPNFGVPYVDMEGLLDAQVDALRAMPAEERQKVVAAAMQDIALQESRMASDPTKYGWRLPSWERVLSLWKNYQAQVILGGNRSSKSTLASRLAVFLAEAIPEAEISCWTSNEDRSVADQQRFIWEALPEKYKQMEKTRGKAFSVQYTQKGGFVGNVCILPPQPGYKRGSTIKFQNYRQHQQDSNVAEGWRAHFIWLDEEAPRSLFETLFYRLIDYQGRMMLTFTTISGWTPLVADILGKVRDVETRYAKLVNRKLPTLQESRSRENTVVHYFWTEDNPFIPPGDLDAILAGRPLAERLARAYGVPQKSATTVFPKFGAVNILKSHEDLPWLREGGKGADYPVTRYMVLDGAGARNWFMVWVAVDASGTWWIYREWPDVETVGEWAEPGVNPGGVRGPGQQSLGFGSQEYVDLIKKLEDGEEIFERYIDPRFGSTEKQTRDGVITPEEELSELGLDFIPAPGVQEDAGIQLLNTLMAYNEEKPLSATNSPRLFVSPKCQNVIFCLQEYTASQGPNEPTKDPVDSLRYLATAKIEYIDFAATGAGSRVRGY